MYPRSPTMPSRLAHADIVAEDSGGRPVLIVEVKTRPLNGSPTTQLTKNLSSLRSEVPFAMMVDPRVTAIYSWDGQRLSDPLCELPTESLLKAYDPDFGATRILHVYLVVLVEAWLRDLAYGWKSSSPPAREELRRIGLLSQLAGGTTHAEVPLRADPLS